MITLPHSPDLFYSFLGAMLAGAIPAFLPLPSAQQDPRLDWKAPENPFERRQTGTLLTRGDHLAAVAQGVLELPLRIIDAAEAASFSTEVDVADVDPNDTALLQHSPDKKGVALSHRAVLQQIESYNRAIKLRRDDRLVSWLPLHCETGLIGCFLMPLVTGTPVVMLDPFEWAMNPHLLAAAIKRYHATVCWQPNPALYDLCQPEEPSDQLERMLTRLRHDRPQRSGFEGPQLFPGTFDEAGNAVAETALAAT
jgi:acyl-CoA synthetase (AMP-forming)/AMP-acid ligase II